MPSRWQQTTQLPPRVGLLQVPPRPPLRLQPRENKIMQEQMKELMVAHRTREAACEAEVGAAPEP